MADQYEKKKRNNLKFTLQFDDSTMENRIVIKKLNSLGYRGKAKYVADAILYYMNHFNENEDKKDETEEEINSVEISFSIDEISDMLNMFK